jgi:hypothetical protein
VEIIPQDRGLRSYVFDGVSSDRNADNTFSLQAFDENQFILADISLTNFSAPKMFVLQAMASHPSKVSEIGNQTVVLQDLLRQQ